MRQYRINYMWYYMLFLFGIVCLTTWHVFLRKGDKIYMYWITSRICGLCNNNVRLQRYLILPPGLSAYYVYMVKCFIKNRQRVPATRIYGVLYVLYVFYIVSKVMTVVN